MDLRPKSTDLMDPDQANAPGALIDPDPSGSESNGQK